LNDHHGRITQEFLLPYSHELNPDEFLNQDVKANAARHKRLWNQQELLCNVRSCLQSTQRHPAIVSNYFLTPSVQYASNTGRISNICGVITASPLLRGREHPKVGQILPTIRA